MFRRHPCSYPFDLIDLLPQAGHDPAAGDVEGPGRQAQLGGHRGDVPALDAGAPEGLPGRFLKMPAGTLGRAGEDLAAILDVEQGGVVVARGLGLQERDHLGPSGPEAGRLPAAGGQEVDDQVAGDPREPRPERAPGGVGVPLLDRGGDRAEDVLREVVRVGLLHPLGAGEAMDQRLVDLHELDPRPLVAGRLEADQQARSGGWNDGQGILLERFTNGPLKSYSVSAESGERRPAAAGHGRGEVSPSISQVRTRPAFPVQKRPVSRRCPLYAPGVPFMLSCALCALLREDDTGASRSPGKPGDCRRPSFRRSSWRSTESDR